MKARERLRYRRSTVGFLWQQTGRNLLAQLTAAENISAADGAGERRQEQARRTGPATCSACSA